MEYLAKHLIPKGMVTAEFLGPIAIGDFLARCGLARHGYGDDEGSGVLNVWLMLHAVIKSEVKNEARH